MQRGGPSMMTLPPFGGAVRRIVLAYVVAFFGLALLHFALPQRGSLIEGALSLIPMAVVHGWVWQLVTYTFVGGGILNTAFALLTLWFTGSSLEGMRGPQWVAELFYVSVIGGGVVATILAMLHVFGLRPDVPAWGAWSAVFGMLVAFAILFAEQEIVFFFVLRMKAKYLVLIYVLIEIAMLIRGEDRLAAAVQLSAGLCGYLYVRFAPRRGLSYAVTERYFGVRNSYFRWKRRRAAKKFEVYMRKQDRVVHFDSEGRYIAPEDESGSKRSDKKWMN